MNYQFLNKYEQVTYEKIRAVTDQRGAHVFAKVRLADILPITGSGISSDLFSFSLKSHVDFLVTNSEQNPQFVVEFDGPTHQTQVQIGRDKKKNYLLQHFNVPFVRINARYLQDKYRGLDLLTYFVEVWFLAEAFEKAQAEGHIPDYEVFDPALVVSSRTPEGEQWPYWLSVKLQIKIKKLHESKTITNMVPNYWIGEDKNGNLRCISWIFIDTKHCVFIETGMREHNFPVWQSDLLSQIAIFDLYDELTRALKGEANAKTSNELGARLAFYEKSYIPRSSLGESIQVD